MSGLDRKPRKSPSGASAAAEAVLRRIGAQTDPEIDLAEGALAFARLDRPRTPIKRYRVHLAEIAAAVDRHARGQISAIGRIGALAEVIHGEEGYSGDADTYDDLQNANLMQVIDRRKGLPVALGILYLSAARAQGWSAYGLNFPGHFLIGLESGTERIVFDPFAGERMEGASALRGLLKAVVDRNAELTPANYAAMANRSILLRLQNNIKTRLAAAGRFSDAVAVAERMLLVAPDEVSLYRDLGLFQAEAGNLGAALEQLGTFIDRTPDETERHRATVLLRKIRSRLN